MLVAPSHAHSSCLLLGCCLGNVWLSFLKEHEHGDRSDGSTCARRPCEIQDQTGHEMFSSEAPTKVELSRILREIVRVR